MKTLQRPDGIPKNNLSDFAKEIIRDCVEQPKNSVYKTFACVFKCCPKSEYTIEQVGKYLRRVRKGIEKSQIPAPVNNHTHNLPDVPNYLPNRTTTLSKTASTTTKRQELVSVSGGVF